MSQKQQPERVRGLTAIIVQIWLLSATLETYLEGHQETALPAAIASGILFLACTGLYLYVEALDRRARKH